MRQLAKKAGINSGGLARIENGRTSHSPRPDTLNKLARALDVPLTDLLIRVGCELTPPDLPTYLCARYGPLPNDVLTDACRYIEGLIADCGIDPHGPASTEDEYTKARH
ncbi:helix-turn-helix domain-containing protein [Thermomonospora umbrina]|nr:helix-turn-helix transcriptional regulator [Thermomonospora umbrina]